MLIGLGEWLLLLFSLLVGHEAKKKNMKVSLMVVEPT